MFDDIPPELLQLVTNYIVDDEMDTELRLHYLNPLLLVNRHWRAHLLTILWRVLDIGLVSKPEHYNYYLTQALSFSDSIRRLSLISKQEATWDSRYIILRDIIQDCLQKLSISYMDISPISFRFSILKKLDLFHVVFDDSLCIEFPCLINVKIESCICLEDDLLKNFLQVNQNIVSLSVAFCNITDESVSSINNLPLVELDISGTRISLTGLSKLQPRHNSLMALGLGSMPYTQRQSFEFGLILARFRSLRILDIQKTGCALNAILLDPIPWIQKLSFGTTSYLQELTLRYLFDLYPLLKEIQISNVTPVSDLALCHIIKRSKGLKKLILPNVPNRSSSLHLITSGTLLLIPGYLKDLKHLDAASYPFNHYIIAEMAHHCKHLEYLNISFPVQKEPCITPDTIEYLLKESKSLKKLVFKGSTTSTKIWKNMQLKYWKTLLIY